jgi:excisionase family DNA binding protein
MQPSSLCNIADRFVILRKNLRGEYMPGEELLTVEEVAKELRVTPKTVRTYISNGELVAIALGKGYKITRNDLDDFIRRRRTDYKPTNQNH